jgi:hypothetical protein
MFYMHKVLSIGLVLLLQAVVFAQPIVRDVRFRPPHGLYDGSLSVTISTTTPGATIYYTVDGSEPTPSNGLLYDEPLEIEGSASRAVVTLSAAAFKNGQDPSPSATSTYIFLDHVPSQPSDPDGFPSQWGPAPTADYAMDPQIVQSPTYRGLIRDSLSEIPSMSLVTDVSDMFGPNGIYSNSLRHGDEWERVASLELLFPDGQTGFQVNCGVRIIGGASRKPGTTPKHSFRIVFRAIYGPSKLDFPVFADAQTNKFDALILRSNLTHSWLHPRATSRKRTQFLRDQFVRNTQLDMRRLSSHGTFVHLYVSGHYWGLYNLMERPNGDFISSYLGGVEEDYDVLNSGEAIDGDRNAWETMMALANDGLSRDSDYRRIQEYLDVPNLIDYMLLNFYTGTHDWPFHNWYVGRKREPGAQYRFYSWDAENCLGSVNDNRTNVDDDDTPARLYDKLRENTEFRLLFADSVHRNLFNGGALTPAKTRARWTASADVVDLAVIAESARWGDYRRDVHSFEEGPYELYTRADHWLPERNRLLTTYLPQRSAIVIRQLKSAGLYPDVDAPVFKQHGGDIAPGFVLTMTLPAGNNGTIYYTTDGSDPRIPFSGAISGKASSYSGGVVLNKHTQVKARLLSGATWSALNQAVFTVPTALEPLRISEIMYNPIDGQDAEFLELTHVGTRTLNLSGLAFTKGIGFIFPPDTALEPGAFLVLVSNPSVFAQVYPDVPIGGVYSGNLASEGERLLLEDADGNVLLSVDYDDEDFWPVGADGFGYSLVLANPAGDGDDPTTWRASADFGGSPGTADPSPLHAGVVINEILTRTTGPLEDAIELYNITEKDIAVGGWYLSDSRINEANLRKFKIAAGTVIKAGGYIVFYEFQLGTGGAGGAGFSLSSRGDGVYLSAADGGGDLTGYIVGHDFEAAESGVSMGRYFTSTGQDFTALETPTFGIDAPQTVQQFRTGQGAANAPPKVGPVVINEILYNPLEPEEQFLELHNVSNAEVTLFDAQSGRGWKISGVQDGDGSNDFKLGPDAVIPAGGYLVVVGIDPEEFRSLRGGLNGVRVVGPFAGALDNSGERIRLSKPADAAGGSYIRIDQVRYNDKAPWPAEPDGEGPSLERRQSGVYGNDARNWGTSARVGGSPGVLNSVAGTEAPDGGTPRPGGGNPGGEVQPGGAVQLGGGGSGGGGCALARRPGTSDAPLEWMFPYMLLAVGYAVARPKRRYR